MNNGFIQKLKDFVEVNLANENFGVEDLVRESGMSHSNLHRKLKSFSNQTISQFIREIRLLKAKDLLLNDDLTVAEISYRVGFGSPTYFNKCFHEYFGYPPGEFKYQVLNHGYNDWPVKSPTIKQLKLLGILIFCLIIILSIVFFLVYYS